MPDDYGQMNSLSTVGAAPTIQAPQQAPATPGWQQTLQQILPAVIPALGAFLTSSKWAGPGAAVGRGLLAGYAGSQIAQQGPSPEDRFYEERIKDMQAERKRLEQYSQNREALLKGEQFTPEDRALAAGMDEKEFNQFYMNRASREGNIEMLTRYHVMTPDEASRLSDVELAQAAKSGLDARAKGGKVVAHSGMPMVTVDAAGNASPVLDSRTGKPIIVPQKPTEPKALLKDVEYDEKTGKQTRIYVDPTRGTVVARGGELPPKTAAETPTEKAERAAQSKAVGDANTFRRGLEMKHFAMQQPGTLGTITGGRIGAPETQQAAQQDIQNRMTQWERDHKRHADSGKPITLADPQVSPDGKIWVPDEELKKITQ